MPSDGAPFCVELFWAMPLLLLQPGRWPDLLFCFASAVDRYGLVGGLISLGFRPVRPGRWPYFVRLSTVYGLVGGLVSLGFRPFTAWSVACTFFYISLASPEAGSARTTIASYSNRRWTG